MGKCVMQIMKSGKRHLTNGMGLPNQDKIRSLGEKDIYKYLDILEADTTKQVEMKDKSRRNISGEPENYSRQNYVAKRNEYLGCILARYSGSFLKWDREEL